MTGLLRRKHCELPALQDKKWDVLGIGAVAVDDILYVDHYPDANTKTAVRATIRQGGGLAGTALVAAARMGAKTAYLGVLGRDELSEYVVDEFEREGVDCSTIERREGTRPFHSFVVSDTSNGERTIFYSGDGIQAPDANAVTAAVVEDSRVLFVDHTWVEIAVFAAGVARELQIPVVADLERWTDPRMTELVQTVDHLIVGIDFARVVTGPGSPEEVVQKLSEMRAGRAASIVTAGDQGAWWVGPDALVHHQAAFQVPVVDTTGCGDVFHGAYAAALAAGDPLERVILIASAAAAIKATHQGGRSGIPDREAIEAFLKRSEARRDNGPRRN